MTCAVSLFFHFFISSRILLELIFFYSFTEIIAPCGLILSNPETQSGQKNTNKNKIFFGHVFILQKLLPKVVFMAHISDFTGCYKNLLYKVIWDHCLQMVNCMWGSQSNQRWRLCAMHQLLTEVTRSLNYTAHLGTQFWQQ